MKFIGHILASLLAVTLSLTIVLWIFGATLGNATYLERQIDQAKVYDQIATQLPDVDPVLIRDKTNELLPQFIDYYTKGAPAPVGDFGAGPVTLAASNPQILSATQSLRPIGLYLPLGALALTLMIIGLMRDRRFPILARAAFGAAISVAVSAGLIWIGPGLALQNVASPGFAPLRTALSPLVASVTHDIATQLGIAALALIGLAIILKVVHGLSRLKARFMKAPKAVAKNQLPLQPGIGPR